MKIRLQQMDCGEEEIFIKYRQMTPEIEELIRYVEGHRERLLAVKDGQQFMIGIHEVVYLESVDGMTWLYTEQDVYRTDLTLTFCEACYREKGFFRCSKSMVINIYRIRRLKSMPGNRIDATMDNGEHVVISRHYAGELRKILGGKQNEKMETISGD